MINEVSRTIKSNGNKHRMLIPVYKENGIVEAKESNLFEKVEKSFTATSKEKKKMDVLTLAELTPLDESYKRERIRITFGFQASAMIRNAIQFVCSKYTNIYCDMVIAQDKIKKLEHTAYFDSPFKFKWSILGTFIPDIENSDWQNDLLYNIGAYFTNDETCITDNTHMLMSKIIETFFEYEISDYKYPEIIESLQQSYFDEMYDILYTTFSKLFCIARDYCQYGYYTSIQEARNKKVKEIEQECNEIEDQE